MRLSGAGFGRLRTASSGGHSDVFLDSPTGAFSIGARLDWGGSIVFFGMNGAPGSNTIDANDTGRELQVAIYDPDRVAQGCAYNTSCRATASPCANSITFLGWNPVQGGDECGHGSTASHARAGDALRLVSRPLQWNPDWDAPDCRRSRCGASGREAGVTQAFELRFVREHVVEVAMEVTETDGLSHAATAQEWPTLYVSHGAGGPDLSLLLDASGRAVSIATPANDGFLYDDFTSPESWVTYQNPTRDYGVGLAMDQGGRGFQGWRGTGRPAPYFHNVRANAVFGLPAGGAVRGLAYLALGSYDTVASELRAVRAARPPFGQVDAPSEGAETVLREGEPLALAGWALDSPAPSSIRVELDGAPVATLATGHARPDVCASYPAWEGCPDVGFEGTVPTQGWSRCAHRVDVIARDPEGNETRLGSRLVRITR